MQYEDRYVALIDILGFSARILADQNGSGAAELAQIYEEIREALKPHRDAVRADWISLTLFSDTVVVSTLASDDDADIDTISEFLWCLRRISLILLSHGFLSRGCVLKDRVVHNGDFVVRGVPQIGEANARQQLSFSYVVAAGKTLDDALEATADFPEQFEKVKWFAKYFNASIFAAYKSRSEGWPQPIEIGGYF